MARKKTDADPTSTPPAAAPRVSAVVRRRDVITQRLANPFGGTSLAIPCTQKDRHGQSLYQFRIVNGAIAPDHVWRTTSQKGWEFATPDLLAGQPSDFGFELRDGRLVRGDRGQEVLMAMHRDDFHAIQQAKAARNSALVSAKATKAAIVETASNELGDEPADFLNRSIRNIEIRDQAERVTDADAYVSSNE
jgi:hypothetical protein